MNKETCYFKIINRPCNTCRIIYHNILMTLYMMIITLVEKIVTQRYVNLDTNVFSHIKPLKLYCAASAWIWWLPCASSCCFQVEQSKQRFYLVIKVLFWTEINSQQDIYLGCLFVFRLFSGFSQPHHLLMILAVWFMIHFLVWCMHPLNNKKLVIN